MWHKAVKNCLKRRNILFNLIYFTILKLNDLLSHSTTSSGNIPSGFTVSLGIEKLNHGDPANVSWKILRLDLFTNTNQNLILQLTFEHPAKCLFPGKLRTRIQSRHCSIFRTRFPFITNRGTASQSCRFDLL